MRFIARYALAVLVAAGLFTACQKEYSFEKNGNVIVGGGTSDGSIGGTGGTCTNTQKAGILGVGIPLTDSNKLVVEMNFTQIGTYSISTDTLDGIYFSKTGTITATGPTQVTLTGSGTPVAAGDFVFTVTYKNSFCTFPLSVYDVAAAVGNDYFPTTAKSYWQYISSSPQATATDTLRNISDNAVFTINSQAYNLFRSESDFGTDSLFYRKGNGEYHEFGDIDIAGVASNIVPGDYIFLKDNVDVGTQWESLQGNAYVDPDTLKMKLAFQLTEKNVDKVVGNKIFRNVIVVRTTEQVLLPTGWTDVLSYETWYAKGIGVINVAAPVPVYGFRITGYNIVP